MLITVLRSIVRVYRYTRDKVRGTWEFIFPPKDESNVLARYELVNQEELYF